MKIFFTAAAAIIIGGCFFNSVPVIAQNNAQALLISRPQSTGGGAGTWTLVQFKYFDSAAGGTGGSACTTTGTSCTVTIAAPCTSGGKCLLVAIQLYGGSAVAATNTPTGGQTWTHCGGTNSCFFGSAANGATDAWYTVAGTATAQTTVVCNYASANNTSLYNSCGLYEYKWSGSTVAFDVSAGASDASCTTCLAGALGSLAGTDVAIQTAISVPASVGVTALTGAVYVNPKQFYSNTGNAGALNLASGVPTNPSWTNGSTAAALVVMGIAFAGS